MAPQCQLSPLKSLRSRREASADTNAPCVPMLEAPTTSGAAANWNGAVMAISPQQRFYRGLPAYQGAPARHKCATCAFTEGVAHGAANPDWDTLEIASYTEQESQGGIEGTPVWRTHRSYERDSRNRAKAIVFHGNTCLGCGFSFDSVYTPEHARGYIEVHHIHPLSAGPRIVDPYSDLIPLCANCHRMVHRRSDDWLSLRELQQLLRKPQGETDNSGYQ